MSSKPSTIIFLLAITGLGAVLACLLLTRTGRLNQPLAPAVSSPVAQAEPVKNLPPPVQTPAPVMQKPGMPGSPVFSLIQPEVPDLPQMDLIIGKEPSAEMLTRVKAVAALGNDLSPDQINTLYRLMAKREGDDSLELDGLNLLKNEAAETLLRQNVMPQLYANNLSAMFLDERYDWVWRDYCMQFLGRCLSRQNHEDKALVVRVLWYVADKTKGPIAGTTLIALQFNIEDPLIGRQRVFDLSHAWVISDDAHPDIRTTALQVSAGMGDKRILPMACTLASNASLSLRLRVSAIAVIGQLGDHTQRDLLEQYAQQDNASIRLAAKAALKRLKT